MPLRDLFIWSTEKASPEDISGAIDVGPATIKGTRGGMSQWHGSPARSGRETSARASA
jgi:hypothetical protein